MSGVAALPPSTGRRAVVLTVLAVLWSVGLLAVAFLVPIYGSATLVGENGPSAILVAGAPAVISMAVWFALGWAASDANGSGPLDAAALNRLTAAEALGDEAPVLQHLHGVAGPLYRSRSTRR